MAVATPRPPRDAAPSCIRPVLHRMAFPFDNACDAV